MKTVQTLCSTLLLTGVALVCGNAIAAELVQEQRIVNYADLNLNNAAGVEVLYRRIRTAARSVCGPTNEVLPALRADDRKCVKDALEDAITRVDNVNLTAYHLQKAGKKAGEKFASQP